jgi:hypothetical protein
VPGNTSSDGRTDEALRLEVALQIVEIFRWERFSYLGLSFLTACIVIFAGYKAFQDAHLSSSELTLLFGSGGIVGFNISRLLTMFTTVIEKVFNADSAKVGGK